MAIRRSATVVRKVSVIVDSKGHNLRLGRGHGEQLKIEISRGLVASGAERDDRSRIFEVQHDPTVRIDEA